MSKKISHRVTLKNLDSATFERAYAFLYPIFGEPDWCYESEAGIDALHWDEKLNNLTPYYDGTWGLQYVVNDDYKYSSFEDFKRIVSDIEKSYKININWNKYHKNEKEN